MTAQSNNESNESQLHRNHKADFFDVLRSRRSVRVFNGTPVPADVVEQCLELALCAPNSSNLQPWEFHWLKSKEKREQAVPICLGQPAAATAAEIIVCVARTNTWRQARSQMLERFAKDPTTPESAKTYYQKLVPLVYSQGPLSTFGFLKRLIGMVVGLVKPVPREPSSHNDMKIWAVKSAALAAQNLMLSFRAFGFDTCPMEGLDSKRMKKLLKLPCDAVIVMAFGIGVRSEKGVYGPQVRFDKKDYIKVI